MSNVPSHNRTRHTHRHGQSAGGSRRSHQHSGYLPPLMGAEQVYEQIAIDEAGQVTSGQISPGAIHDPAQFAAGIQPVLLVDGLPTLPDNGYPEDVIVFDISVTPRVLYKNEGDVWVKLIGPDDIQANSITAGQIAAGAISTSELAIGARLVGEYQNEDVASPGVFIDDTGILIRDGKLTLEDEFGLTSMEASGFSGSWSAFTALGLYNGAFLAGVSGVVGLGRTVALPYWTVSNDAGTPTLTYLDPGLQITWGAINTTKHLSSDAVPVVGSTHYEFGIVYEGTAGAGVGVGWDGDVWIEWFDASGSAISDSSDLAIGVTNSGSVSRSLTTAVATAPDDAAFAVLHITATEVVGHSASNILEIYGSVLRQVPERAGTLRVDDLQVGIGNSPDDISTIIDGGLLLTGVLSTGDTSFPGSPLTGEQFFRSDMNMWFVYTGTRWICTCPHFEQVEMGTVQPFSATSSSQYVALPDFYGSNVFVEDIKVTFFVASGGTALSGSHKWVITAAGLPSGSAIWGTIASIDSGASNAWREAAVDVEDTLLGTDSVVRLTVTKTGTPGNLTMIAIVAYRVVAA